jgi:CRP-like cAMP-binding protein
VIELNIGAEFGELALINRKPRAASVYTETETYLAVLDKESFNRILKKTQVEKNNEHIEAMNNFSLFK